MSAERHADAIEVTQADREAAAELIESYWAGLGREDMHKLAQSYRDGLTQGVWAWAFARHRIAAMDEARAEAAGDTYRHKKRGTVYTVIGMAELQMATDCLVDGSELVVYRGEDGRLWARWTDEFHDGRFELIERGEHLPERKG